jgi:toxin ParE1/3/4
MVKKIIWSPRAANNLEHICDYIAKDSEYYASLVAKRIIAIVEALPRFPYSGRIVPEYQETNLREKIYKHYRIIYRIKEESIEIVAIYHGARLLSDI